MIFHIHPGIDFSSVNSGRFRVYLSPSQRSNLSPSLPSRVAPHSDGLVHDSFADCSACLGQGSLSLLVRAFSESAEGELSVRIVVMLNMSCECWLWQVLRSFHQHARTHKTDTLDIKNRMANVKAVFKNYNLCLPEWLSPFV